jgi:hypothetical protein
VASTLPLAAIRGEGRSEVAKVRARLRGVVPLILKPAIRDGSWFFVFCGERTDPPSKATPLDSHSY